MTTKILLYLGAFLPLFWGIAHLVPTKSIVKEFGDISIDNKRIITMEWIIEGVSLIFIGVIIFTVTCIDSSGAVSRGVYFVTFIFLNVFSVISLKTGFKINFAPYKLCPIIFTSSSILILLGGVL